MPDEIYGTNYNLTDEMNVSTHYIHNDLQTTHINSASVNKASSKVVVSALIPGSIGEFNLKTGGYEELAHGFRGCHGARYHDEDYIYFTDSNQGALYTIDEMKKTNRVFSVDSKWLHDVEHIYNDVFVFATSDKNSIMFINIVTGDVIDNIQFKTCDAAQTDINFSPPTDWFGNTVQFFHFWKLEDPSDFHKNVSRMPA
jgi:hypothetical protein